MALGTHQVLLLAGVAWLMFLLQRPQCSSAWISLPRTTTTPKQQQLPLSLLLLSATAAGVSSTADIMTTDPQPPSQVGGALSMSVSELEAHLGGWGRAKLAWDCYRIGVDPAHYFGAASSADESDENIQRLLPGSRRKARLGTKTLQKLADINGGMTVDGGIATLVDVRRSRDTTTKLLLRLRDGTEVETVIIPWKGTRSTLCISSQVGCRQGCTFCATGRMGKLRSLTSDEILSQMFFAKRITRQLDLPTISNVVFMGMGEPADNADQVNTALKILTTRELFQLSSIKVTVSTVAPTPEAFERFDTRCCVLAWSVHAARDDLRKQLVPTTQYKMTELRDGLIRALLHRPAHMRTAMLEVALIDQVNDSLREADELKVFARHIIDTVPDCKLIVNLIPYNDIGIGDKYRKPNPDQVVAFQRRLWEFGIFTHIRTTRGDDESAACGQLVTLRNKNQKQKAASTT